MAPADPKKLFDPKLNKNESEFDRSNFIYKETVYAIQYYTCSFFTRRSESCEFLGQFLTNS